MVLPEERDYLDRRAGECAGDRAAALRRVIAEARALRHDPRGSLGALDLIEACLTSECATKEEAARPIADLRHELRAPLGRLVGGE